MAEILPNKTYSEEEMVEIAKSSTDAYVNLHLEEFKALNVDEFTSAYTQIYMAAKKTAEATIRFEEEKATKAATLF